MIFNIIVIVYFIFSFIFTYHYYCTEDLFHPTDDWMDRLLQIVLFLWISPIIYMLTFFIQTYNKLEKWYSKK